jgi:MoxR-like ATPase
MSARESILALQERMAQSIIGQSQVIERILLTLLCNGNLLLEGLPGLAKTRAIKSLAANLDAEFRRSAANDRCCTSSPRCWRRITPYV